MGTTAQKLQRVLDTKEGLKDTINTYLGQDITSAIPFKDYETYIKNFYGSLPKTDYAEGSNITLSNTLKGKLDFEDGIVGYGDTKQEGTPTPDNPQDIEVVRGKNLLDESTWEIGSIDATTGQNAVGPIEFRTSGYIEVNGSVTLSNYNYLDYTYRGIFEYDSNKNYIKRTNDNTVSKTTPFTLNLASNTRYIRIRYIVGTTVISIPTNMQIQLEKGSQATSYLPYNTLEVVERGINLLDKTQVVGNNTATTVTQINTGFRVSAEALGYAGVTTIDVKANTNYFLKFNTNVIVDSGAQKYVRVFAGTTQTTTIATYTFTEGGGTFNTGNNTKINIWFYCSLGGSGTVDYTNVQLQEGSTATTYEPYQTPQTYQLSLGEYEFAKIGNYVDTIEYDVENDKVYKNEVINKYQFTGNENFGKAASTNLNGYIFNFPSVTTNILAPANNGIKANILSNAFITKAVDTIISEATYGIGIRSDKYLYIGAPLGSFENVSELQTYLANNITFMYYTLITPVKKEITTTLKNQIKALYNSHSFTGTTIIEIDGQLPLIIKVRALKGE